MSSLVIDESKPAEGLAAELEQAKQDMQAALANSFDTPQAMRIILELVKNVNVHVKERKNEADLATVEAVARWVTKMVGIFGLDENAKPPYEGLGWASAAAADQDPSVAVLPYSAMFTSVRTDVQTLALSSESMATLVGQQDPDSEFAILSTSGVRDVEELAMPYLRSVSKLRDELRRLVPSESAETKKAILELTDRIRDVDCTNLGVYLDDRPDGQASLIKFVPASELIAAREEKKGREAEKARQKEEKKRLAEQAEKEKAERAKVSPLDMFRTEQYSEWDDKGLPTKTKEGAEVSKSLRKKMEKDHARQKKLHEEYLAKAGSAN